MSNYMFNFLCICFCTYFIVHTTGKDIKYSVSMKGKNGSVPIFSKSEIEVSHKAPLDFIVRVARSNNYFQQLTQASGLVANPCRQFHKKKPDILVINDVSEIGNAIQKYRDKEVPVCSYTVYLSPDSVPQFVKSCDQLEGGSFYFKIVPVDARKKESVKRMRKRIDSIIYKRIELNIRKAQIDKALNRVFEEKGFFLPYVVQNIRSF